MPSKDLITIVMLIVGLVWVTIFVVLIKLGRLKLEMWPRFFGIGAGVYMFISSMAFNILLRPRSEFMDYTISNVLWSLAFGIMGYFGGRIIVHNTQKKKR
jgi:hypothetical protein